MNRKEADTLTIGSRVHYDDGEDKGDGVVVDTDYCCVRIFWTDIEKHTICHKDNMADVERRGGLARVIVNVKTGRPVTHEEVEARFR